jgi:thiamine biosynthesis lipoprotein
MFVTTILGDRLLLLWLIIGCGPQPELPSAAPQEVYRSAQGEAFGTTWNVTWKGDAASADEVSTMIARRLATVDAQMSTWREDSELSLVRRATGPVTVSRATADVVSAALALSAQTGGAFDPTVQPLMELWGFHGEPRDDMPAEQEIDAVRAQVGWGRVRVTDSVDGSPQVDAGGTALDLSAIAKGHAVDRVSEGLSEMSLADHLVEIGGEVRALGDGRQGDGWRLGIETPQVGSVPGSALHAVVRLREGALATSGNYRNRYVVDGHELGHTMDPRTGRPAISSTLSASVVAPTCRTADGLATALMVMDPKEGLALVASVPGVEALILSSSEGRLVETMTSGMETLLGRQASPEQVRR